MVAASASTASFAEPAAPERVRIASYDGEAMEPFVTRDGKFLFFNTKNDPGVDTNIHVAEVSFDGYFPDPAEPTQAAAREALRVFAAQPPRRATAQQSGWLRRRTCPQSN